jgi:hypothetical protein
MGFKARPGENGGFGPVYGELLRLLEKHTVSLNRQETDDSVTFTGPVMKRWNKELWFGGVRMGKNYVSFHLMPVYMYPDLLDGVSEILLKRMQGKSCFNFRQIDPNLFQELDALTATCVQRLELEGIL